MPIFEHWPNRITALRFLGALALFAILAILVEKAIDGKEANRLLAQAAFWLFILTAASDFLDGYLARRGNQITAFGRIADPFVDKVLIMGVMVFLAVLPWSQRWFPAWIVVVMLAREFLVTGLRGYVESLGRQFPADWFGKTKMVLQCTAVGMVLGIHAFDFPDFANTFLEWTAYLLVYSTLVSTVLSCISYLSKTRQLLLGRST
jgi:CDP-diacylglycerol---glycerol-3-phosphate 3-phosphatidyltransferase